MQYKRFTINLIDIFIANYLFYNLKIFIFIVLRCAPQPYVVMNDGFL